MIDRLAKALMRADGYDPNNTVHWQARGEHYRRTVDLILTEMVEPTDAMIAVGRARQIGETISVPLWRAMITAARQS